MADLALTRTEQNIDDEPLASAVGEEIHLVDAAYHPGLELLALTLSDGRRLLVPCEDLSELKGASPEQIADFSIGPHGSHLWWRQIDDGIHLPEFLEFRWGNVGLVDRRDGGCRYRVEGLE
jgi:hypothetical protein